MKRAITMLLMIGLLTGSASAAKIGTATTSVYVRDPESKEIVGSLAAGDTFFVTGKSGGWYKAKIGDQEYIVYSDYVCISDGDGSGSRSKPRKQGQAKDRKVDGNGVIVGSKSSHKITKGSAFGDW